LTAHDHRTTVQRLFNDVWNGRRLDLVEELYAPDFVVDYRPYAPLGVPGQDVGDGLT
jgi:hypothetical protein